MTAEQSDRDLLWADVYRAALRLAVAERDVLGLRGMGNVAAMQNAMQRVEAARPRLTTLVRLGGMKDFQTWLVGGRDGWLIIGLRGQAGAGVTVPDDIVEVTA